MPDQAGRHGVEHLAQGEAATRRDVDEGLLEVGSPVGRQRLEDAALDLDLLCSAGILLGDHLVDEAAIVRQVGEVPAAPKQQRIADDAFEMAMRALDGAVLMGNAAVVAARDHAVMAAQVLIAAGQVLGGIPVQVAESRRQAVAAMIRRRPAERPESVLQSFGQGDEALAAQDDMGMLPAGISQAEVEEAVIERLSGNGHSGIGHVGEVRQAHPAGLMLLPEDDVLVRTVDGPPGPDPALQRPADLLTQVRVPPAHLGEHGNRAQTWSGFEHRHHLAVPDPGQRIRTAPATG